MARFFTSDWHLNSNNILKYANRPFVSAGDAASKLVDNCNEVAKWKTDIVFHVGDFWKKGVDRHDKKLGEDDANLSATFDDYIRFINARFILLEGNHDTRNCEADMKSMMIDLNQNYKEVFVTHYPSDNPNYHGRTCANWTFGKGINLCGHVHDKWILHYDKQKKILNINVSVDCWGYKPVKDTELTEMLDFIKDAKVKTPKDTLTPAEFLKWCKMNEKQVETDRLARKQVRYAKKGLTPEICKQRKLEAMKKKGLI